RHASEDTSALGHIADPRPCNLPGRETGDLLPAQEQPAIGGFDDASDRLEKRRLARTVAPEQRDDFPLASVQGGAIEDVALAIERMQPLCLQNQFARAGCDFTSADNGRGPGPGIDLLNLAICPHDLWRTIDQDFAFIHHRDLLAEGKDAVD